MENKINRKYNSIFRKNLKDKIAKLNSKNDYMYIYKIVSDELENKISINMNGVYFNINLLSDESIELINNFISDKNDILKKLQLIMTFYMVQNYQIKIKQFLKDYIKNYKLSVKF